jgi:hypothetical protein
MMMCPRDKKSSRKNHLDSKIVYRMMRLSAVHPKNNAVVKCVSSQDHRGCDSGSCDGTCMCFSFVGSCQTCHWAPAQVLAIPIRQTIHQANRHAIHPHPTARAPVPLPCRTCQIPFLICRWAPVQAPSSPIRQTRGLTPTRVHPKRVQALAPLPLPCQTCLTPC